MDAQATADPTATLKDELTPGVGEMFVAQMEEHELDRFPARRMPNELLAETFQHVHDLEKRPGRLDWNPPFLQVCRAWRAVGEYMSECWSDITIHPCGPAHTRELLQLRLERSAKKDLTLSFSTPSIPSDAWDLLVSHSDRWTYLSIERAAQGFPLECAPIQLPKLEIVELEFFQVTERLRPLSITLLDDAPLLSDITLRLWDMPPIQHSLLPLRWFLTELSISVMTLPYDNQTACLSIIQSFSFTLQILRLLEGVTDEFKMPAENIPPIELPFVSHLRSERTCYKLLSLLAVPQLKSLTLDHTTFEADTVACVERLADNSNGMLHLRFITVDSSYQQAEVFGAPKGPNHFLAFLRLYELRRVNDLVVTHYRDRPDKYPFDQDRIVHDLSLIKAMAASDDDDEPALLPHLKRLSLAYFGAYPCNDSRGDVGDGTKDDQDEDEDGDEDDEGDNEVDRDGYATAHAMRDAIQEMADSRGVKRQTRFGIAVNALQVYTDIPEWSYLLPPASP
ncbi:hypothetical protein BD626DRAFT_37804 [Schizophyllum amplum]|uniref:F-box domain-containing protein n=1 Tax=Schizophyllum amplum TaxID=97359 RepID=A0A550BT21_9AGAR|nr:hypothetical protein BD626DRAFT_37804 [Auriculariopsis ampla]